MSRSRVIPPATYVRWALVVAAGAVGARHLYRDAAALRTVAPDLRTPIMFLPVAPGGPRHLKAMRRMSNVEFPVARGVSIASTNVPSADGRPIRIVTYQRSERTRPSAALVWIHGGGTVLGSPEQGNAKCSHWANEIDLLVASVDYRLAPEHPFPAALDDCYDALCWLHDNADDLGVDRSRIAVGGDSAGGMLAAVLCQVARDRGRPPICFQLLEYPMLDDRSTLRPPPRTRSFVWTPAANRFGWTSYLGHRPTPNDDRSYAAPARTTDLSRLPPAWIGVGDIDLLHDEAVTYAARLRRAGVTCELDVLPGLFHGADSIRPKAPTSRAFRNTMTEALRHGITPRSGSKLAD